MRIIAYARRDPNAFHANGRPMKGVPYACFVGLKNEDGSISIGWSKWNRSLEDSPFCKAEGRRIAEARAELNRPLYVTNKVSDCLTHDVPVENFPPSLRNHMADFITRCQKAFDTTYVKNFLQYKDSSVIQ